MRRQIAQYALYSMNTEASEIIKTPSPNLYFLKNVNLMLNNTQKQNKDMKT